jgi:hypothetical protein
MRLPASFGSVNLFSEGYSVMALKTVSAIALGATLVALADDVAQARPVPADQFHWSSAVEKSSGKFLYNGKQYQLGQKAGSGLLDFAKSCDQDVRVRGFLDAKGAVEWSKAEVLCGNLSVGGVDRVEYYTQGGEIKVFGPIYQKRKNNVLAQCQPERGTGDRVWSNCGAIVPNDGSSKVLIGQGSNAGKVLKTAKSGSGIATVEEVLNPEVEQMREKIFRERLAAGYYNN